MHNYSYIQNILCVFRCVLLIFAPFSTVSFHKTGEMRGFLCKKVLTFMQRRRIVCIVKGGTPPQQTLSIYHTVDPIEPFQKIERKNEDEK